MFSFEQLTVPASRRCQDRTFVIRHPRGLVAVIADGAGGMGGGEQAAEMVIAWTRAHVDRINDLHVPNQWVELLTHIDRQISFADGQTTGVIVAISPDGYSGASVGDSVAWIVNAHQIVDLTAAQCRKPLLGSGNARPVAFASPALSGTLLLATDGLVNYAKRPQIADQLHNEDLPSACRALVNLVRLKSGAIPDDIGVILCRPRSTTSKPIPVSAQPFILE